MNPADLVGLRDDDLDPEALAARDALLATDPDARADAALATDLGALLSRPIPGGPTAQQIRDRAAPRSARWPIGALALAAAALLVFSLPIGPTQRDRGTGAAPIAVRLSAVADGPRGPRPLADGAEVGPDEQVVFWVDASGGGTLRLTEDDGAPIHPPPGQVWTATVGSQALGGASPLAWRPDAAGPHRYTVELCAADGTCVTHGLGLRWRAD